MDQQEEDIIQDLKRKVLSPQSMNSLSPEKQQGDFAIGQTLTLLFPLFKIPSSPAVNVLFTVISKSKSLSKTDVNSNQLECYHKGKKRKVTMKKPSYTITLELDDIEKMTAGQKNIKKFLAFILIKLREQAFFNDKLSQNFVSFTLEDLLELNFYKSRETARRGFHNAMKTLTKLKIEGAFSLSSKRKLTVTSLRVLFTGSDIHKKQCTVYLNEQIDWSFLACFYTILPSYYFCLSNRASELLFYIFYLSRQNVDKISKYGSFNISLRAVQNRIDLPDEKANKNPNRTIREPIKEAVAQINELHKQHYQNTDFCLTLEKADPSNISHFLSFGYIKVSFSNEFRRLFLNSMPLLSVKENAQLSVKHKKPQGAIES